MALRADQALIADWIESGSRVLDLGCGDGALLAHLQTTMSVTGYGLEIDEDNIIKCVAAGVNAIQTDVDAGLEDFEAASFDYVIMSQTLQAMRFPEQVLDEILRVGNQGIVTMPNMGYWRSRIQFLLGRMPVTGALPSHWYDTENLHLCTLNDFEALCREKSITILQRATVDHQHKTSLGASLFPNLLGEIALYRFERK